MAENEKSSAYSRRAKEQAKKEHLQSVNAEQYHKSNEKKTEDQKIIVQTATGKVKTKTVELKTYKNGVVKSRLKSVFKN